MRSPRSRQPRKTCAPSASGGVERSYILHLPASRRSGKALPLILVFHGAGGQAREMARHTRLTEEATRRGYAVAYPVGLGRRWSDGRGSATGPGDVEFVRLLLDSLGRELPTDSARIYATGISNGAGMTYRLACDLPGRFAAIAPVAGAVPASMEERCAATAPGLRRSSSRATATGWCRTPAAMGSGRGCCSPRRARPRSSRRWTAARALRP